MFKASPSDLSLGAQCSQTRKNRTARNKRGQHKATNTAAAETWDFFSGSLDGMRPPPLERARTQIAEQKGRMQLLQSQVARRSDVDSELAVRKAREAKRIGRGAEGPWWTAGGWSFFLVCCCCFSVCFGGGVGDRWILSDTCGVWISGYFWKRSGVRCNLCFDTIPILFPLKGWHISKFGVCPFGSWLREARVPPGAWEFGERGHPRASTRSLGRSVVWSRSLRVSLPRPLRSDPGPTSPKRKYHRARPMFFFFGLVGLHGPKSHEQAAGCSWKGVTSNGWLHAGGLDLNKFLLEVCQTWSNKQIKNQALFTKLC